MAEGKGRHIAGLRVLSRNLLANWVGLSADIVVAFFITPFIIGTLGMVIYGVWSLMNSLMGYMGLVDVGIRGSTMRFVNYYEARKEHARVNEVITTSLAVLSLLGGVVLLLVYGLGRHFAVFFPETPANLLADIGPVLLIMGVNLWLTFVCAVLASVVSAQDRYDVINGIHLLVLAARTAGVVFALRHGYGLLGLALALLVSSCVDTLAHLAAARLVFRPLRLRPGFFSLDRLREMWSFGLAVFLQRSARQLMAQSDQIIVMYFFGPAAVGAYAIAQMIAEYTSRFLLQTRRIFAPSIMRSGALRDLAGLRRIFMWEGQLILLVGVLVYIGVAAFGGQFMALWIGPEAAAATGILVILSFAGLIALLEATSSATLFSLGHKRINVELSLGQMTLNIGLSVLLVAAFGMGPAGVALGTLIASIAFMAIAYPVLALRALQVTYWQQMSGLLPRAVAGTALAYAGFVAVAAAWPAHDWPRFLAGVAGVSAVYAVLAPFLLLDRATLRSLVARVRGALPR